MEQSFNMILKQKPAVFLDRDGVLCHENGHITIPSEIEIFEYANECIARIHEKGYWAIVVTNQSGIARGIFTENEQKKANAYLIENTGVDGVYYCPHYLNGKIPQYMVECNCRKPKTGMIDMACKDFPIDMSGSYMVGDRASDILLGKAVGIKTVLLNSGYGINGLEKAVEFDYNYEDLREFVKNLSYVR